MSNTLLIDILKTNLIITIISIFVHHILSILFGNLEIKFNDYRDIIDELEKVIIAEANKQKTLQLFNPCDQCLSDIIHDGGSINYEFIISLRGVENVKLGLDEYVRNHMKYEKMENYEGVKLFRTLRRECPMFTMFNFIYDV